jgi:hypothetical protein
MFVNGEKISDCLSRPHQHILYFFYAPGHTIWDSL